MSPTIIFLLPLLLLLILLPLPLAAVPFLIISVTLLFIIELELVVLTDPFLLREFCNLHSPPTVAHLHQVIAEILFAIYLEVDNNLFELRDNLEARVEQI